MGYEGNSITILPFYFAEFGISGFNPVKFALLFHHRDGEWEHEWYQVLAGHSGEGECKIEDNGGLHISVYECQLDWSNLEQRELMTYPVYSGFRRA